MEAHGLAYVLQPTTPYFHWSLAPEQIEQLRGFIQRYVIEYCKLPFDDGVPSGLDSGTFTLEADAGNIQRIKITFTLTLKPDASFDDVKADIESRLSAVQEKYRGCHFTSPDDPALWNPPTVFLH